LPEWVEEIRGIISVRLYSARACRSIVAQLKGAEWTAAPVAHQTRGGRYGTKAVRGQRSASAFSPADDARVRTDFDANMNRVVKPLLNQVWRADLKDHVSTHVVRYSPGDSYGVHSDTIPEANYRYFTVLCYLNGDFSGGRTSFPSLDYSVRPEAGKAVIFPSSYPHCAEPLLAGEKYVIISWLAGPPPIRWV
jgi:predicted 2-oxoglutarate/Fe(II)-dependent dioxygenase YbiX